MAPLYLAVDAGGTRTTCVLADESQVLARVQTGSIKRMRVSADVAQANLDAAFAELEQAAHTNLRGVVRTCIGIAGESVPLVRDWITNAFGNRVGGDLVLIGDIEIALDAAFECDRGVLVLAGTGSNVAARADDGTVYNVGGWGPVLGDQGSGYWIGREALRRAFISLDEQRPSRLLDAVMHMWSADSFADVVQIAHAVPPPDFSRLSEVIAELAAEGDAVCAAQLQRAGHELAGQALLAMKRVHSRETLQRNLIAKWGGIPPPAWTPPAVACAGSVLAYVEPVREAMTAAIQAVYPDAQVQDGVVEPVMGALWRARQVAEHADAVL